MPFDASLLLITAAICMLISLGLAWLASLILYLKITPLKRLFPATHQLIRAHIDYLLMFGLLVISYFLSTHLELALPMWAIVLLCIGSLYNPFGFIVLAMKPKMANPETVGQKARILIGFLPATIGYGYVMVRVIDTLMT